MGMETALESSATVTVDTQDGIVCKVSIQVTENIDKMIIKSKVLATLYSFQ